MSTESIRLESTSVKLTDYANEPITKDNPLPIDGNISVSVDGGEMVDELETLLTAIKDTDGIKKIIDPVTVQGSVSASVSGNVNAVIPDGSISTAATVTPSDTTDLTTPSKWLYIGVSGDVEAILTGGQTVIFRNLAVGFYPICATRIKAAGTTALNIIAGW
jgi:hypothetical protein